jgi:invasion protein IalB
MRSGARFAELPGIKQVPRDWMMGILEQSWHALADRARSAAILLAALPALLPSGSALAQGAVKSVHKDWQIRCDTPPGAKTEQCALIQSVTAEDRANVGLTVIVLKTADAKSRLMRVVAPLGVLLPSGLGLKIDQADIGRAGFVRCLPNGCIAEVVMDDELIKKLRNGKTATFIIFQTPEEGIGFPMSLAGFGEGYDKLP